MIHKTLKLLFLNLFLLNTAAWADAPSFLQLQQDVDLTGGISRFDWMALDQQTHLLYIAHMGAGQIIVFDTQTSKVKTTLSGFPRVTGLLVIPELHRLYASVAGQHKVFAVDTESLKVVAEIPAGHFSDNLTYVPELRHLYVSDETGGEVTVIDVLKNKRIASIHLEGEVGQVRFDPSSGLVYANVQAKNELIAIDPKTRQVTRHFFILGGKHPHGLYIDPDHHLAFIACDGDNKLVVFDLNELKEADVLDLGHDPDILAFDQGLGYLYVASESGIVSIFKFHDDKMEKIGDFPVGENAHSVAVDPDTHFVYFPIRKLGKAPVLRTMKPTY
jgi:DNA-binding beta-propeller fold protein YncE